MSWLGEWRGLSVFPGLLCWRLHARKLPASWSLRVVSMHAFPRRVLLLLPLVRRGFATVNAFIFSAILEATSDRARCKAQMTRALQEAEHRWGMGVQMAWGTCCCACSAATGPCSTALVLAPASSCRHLPPALTDQVMAYYQLRSGRHREMPSESIMHELAPGLRLQVALSSAGQVLHSIPVLAACPQLLQRIALLVEPQVAAEGRPRPACALGMRGA